MRFYELENWIASWSWRGWLVAALVVAGLCAGLALAERAGWPMK